MAPPSFVEAWGTPMTEQEQDDAHFALLLAARKATGLYLDELAEWNKSDLRHACLMADGRLLSSAKYSQSREIP